MPENKKQVWPWWKGIIWILAFNILWGCARRNFDDLNPENALQNGWREYAAERFVEAEAYFQKACLSSDAALRSRGYNGLGWTALSQAQYSQAGNYFSLASDFYDAWIGFAYLYWLKPAASPTEMQNNLQLSFSWLDFFDTHIADLPNGTYVSDFGHDQLNMTNVFYLKTLVYTWQNDFIHARQALLQVDPSLRVDTIMDLWAELDRLGTPAFICKTQSRTLKKEQCYENTK